MLEEVKAYLHILHEYDDVNLNNLINEGTAIITHYCGPFDIENNLVARRLVKEYVRFAWNGKSEHFYEQYQTDLSSLSFSLWEVDTQ